VTTILTSRPSVVTTSRIFPQTRSLLEASANVDSNEAIEPWPQDVLIDHARQADGIMAFMTDRIDARFLAACPRLRVIGAALKGYDNIDIDACTDAGVYVCIVPDLLTVPTAELAIGLMLGLGRNILAGDAAIRAHGFHGWRATLYGSGLQDATVGILGFGLVGQAIAERLAPFGCRILASDKRPHFELPHALAGTVSMVDPDAILTGSDYVVLALPLTAETMHIIDRSSIARMRPGTRLINPARGSLVDEAAVADALETGHLAGYAADVFECEDWARGDRPAEVEPRLRAASERTILTPHIGSAVAIVRREIELSAARSIIDVLSGRVPRWAVNDPFQQVSNAQSDSRQDVPGHH